MVRAVGHDDRRGADHDGQAQPRLPPVAEIAEQERRGHAGDGDAGREDDQPPVDERERRAQDPYRRGGAEGKPTAPEQGQHDDRRGRDGEPQGGTWGLLRVVSQGDVERARDREQHDQRVEPVPPHEEIDPRHSANLLHRFAGHVLRRSERRIITWYEPRSDLTPTPSGRPARSVGRVVEERGIEHVPRKTSIQPCGPHGSLERRPLEDRDLRLARARRRRRGSRRAGRHQDRRTRPRRGPGSRATWTGS